MEKSELFWHAIITLVAALCAIGCIGAYFYDWTWHNLFIGAFFAMFAIFYANEVADIARQAKNFNEKGGQK